MSILLNGDCVEMMRFLNDNSVDLVVTDPPYDIKNTKAGKSHLQKSLNSYNDELTDAAITGGFDYDAVFEQLIRICKTGNFYFWCNKAQLPIYLKYFVIDRRYSFDLIKWVKTNPIPAYHNKYVSDTEYCIYIRKGGQCMPANSTDGSTLYQAPLNVKDKKLYNHPTIKPIDILQRLIRNSSRPGDTILDPFMGSGSTGVAAKLLGRDFIGIELDETYYNTALKRIDETVI